jgi:hypothetical protein
VGQYSSRDAGANLVFVERAIAEAALNVARRRNRKMKPAVFVVSLTRKAWVKLAHLQNFRLISGFVL